MVLGMGMGRVRFEVLFEKSDGIECYYVICRCRGWVMFDSIRWMYFEWRPFLEHRCRRISGRVGGVVGSLRYSQEMVASVV